MSIYPTKEAARPASHGVVFMLTPRVTRPGAPLRKYPLRITAWVGKAKKPSFNYAVKTVDEAMEKVEELVERQKKHAEYKAEEKAKRAAKVAEMRKQVKVGTLLVNSWGYEQTNVDFYEVVEVSKTGATAKIRKIASRNVKETGPMSADVAPCPGEYIGDKVETKRVNAYGVGDARITTADSSHYCSWYY